MDNKQEDSNKFVTSHEHSRRGKRCSGHTTPKLNFLDDIKMQCVKKMDTAHYTKQIISNMNQKMPS